MRDKVILVIISIILLILDNAFSPFISISGAYPSFLFVFAIAYSIINGKEHAVFIGVVTGLLQDVFWMNGLGVNALINMILCIIAAVIGESIFKTRKLIPVISCIGLSVAKILLIGIVFYLSNSTLNISTSLGTAIYNTVIMFLGYRFVLKLSNKKIMKREWRFK